MQKLARLVLCGILSLSMGQALAATRFGWMQGCWQHVGKDPGSVEQWSAPGGGTLLGMSRTVKGGKTIEFEFVQIKEVAPGVLAYVAQPGGGTPVPFKLLKQAGAEAVFENLDHDFPQRVRYRRDGDQLIARIEGMSKGKLKAIDFPMQKISCDD